jgi:hypothetical protein
MAARQPEVAYVQRGATLTTVYSTFSVTFQNTPAARGHATVVRRTVTVISDNAPAAHIPPMLHVCITLWPYHSDLDDPKKAF